MTSKVVVGCEFNQRAYSDMYANDGLQWGIDVAVENDLRNT